MAVKLPWLGALVVSAFSNPLVSAIFLRPDRLASPSFQKLPFLLFCNTLPLSFVPPPCAPFFALSASLPAGSQTHPHLAESRKVSSPRHCHLLLAASPQDTCSSSDSGMTFGAHPSCPAWPSGSPLPHPRSSLPLSTTQCRPLLIP